MAALSADVIRQKRGIGTTTNMVIGTGATVYIGSLIARGTATARGIAAAVGTVRRVVGVCEAFNVSGSVDADGVGDTSGNERMEVGYGFEYDFNVLTAIRTNTSLGLRVFVSTDNDVGGTAVGTSAVQVVAGTLVAWTDEVGTSKTNGWIKVHGFTSTNIAV